MKGSKRKKFRQKLQYYFDLWLSKGTISMIILLFCVTGIIVVLLSILALLFGGVKGLTLGGALWGTLNHAFDPGVLSGDDGGYMFLFLMLLATLCGVFFMAMLIGLINDGISARVQDLAKGIEPVIEKDHVVILGFNESTLIIIEELIEAYKNQGGKRNAVVVMDLDDKQEMEERIRAQFPDTGNITVVCRSGSVFNRSDLERCSVGTAKSIIVAEDSDFTTIKTILACTQLLNSIPGSKAFITSTISRQENEFAARIAGNDTAFDAANFSVKNDRLELLMMENTVSKIMTHTCRQNGFSKVFTELFNFSGHELYIVRNEGENTGFFRKMTGKTIQDINRCLPSAVAVGVIMADGKVKIGDPRTNVMEPGSKLIVLEEDDDRLTYLEEQNVSFAPPSRIYENEPVRILIMECNSKLPVILNEMCNYLSPGSMIYLAADDAALESVLTDDVLETLLSHNIDSAVQIEKGPSRKGEESSCDIYDYRVMTKLFEECRPDYVLTMSSQEEDDDTADEKSLTLLLYCRRYKMTHPDARFGITCEMRSVVNQGLAQDTMADDFVISRNIASLMMAQIAENRELKDVFESLLDQEGFETYIKRAGYYVDVAGGKEIDLFSLADAVAEKGEVFIGYKLGGNENNSPVLNPTKMIDGKRATVTLSPGDELIVLAEGPEVCR